MLQEMAGICEAHGTVYSPDYVPQHAVIPGIALPSGYAAILLEAQHDEI